MGRPATVGNTAEELCTRSDFCNYLFVLPDVLKKFCADHRVVIVGSQKFGLEDVCQSEAKLRAYSSGVFESLRAEINSKIAFDLSVSQQTSELP